MEHPLKDKLEQYQLGQVLLLDKPLTWTSFDAVKKLKSQFRHKFSAKKIKIGHAGTLDPLATGLLIVCTGKATKTIQDIQDAPKKYEAKIFLGATRPSYDMESEIDQEFPTDHINLDLIKEALKSFQGEIDQMPPIFSALKVNGKKAYDLARAGKEVNLKSRNIKIFSIEITSYKFPYLEIDVHCSKGTYIRSLAYDIGKALHSGAYLAALRRTAIGDYSVDKALDPTNLDLAAYELNQ